MGCFWKENTTATNAAKTLASMDRDIQEIVVMYGALSDHAKSLHNLPDTMAGVDSLVRDMTYGGVNTLDELRSKPELMRVMDTPIRSAIASLFKASSDPAALLASSSKSERILSAYGYQRTIAKSSTAAYRLFNAIFHSIGITSVEAWANRPNMLRQYGPVGEAYLRTTEINNYNDSYNKSNLVRIQEFLDTVENNPVLKENRITRNVFHKIFGLYDLQNRPLSDHDLGNELNTHGIVLNEESLSSVNNTIRQLRDNGWWKVNYGMTRSEMDAKIKAAKDSFIAKNKTEENPDPFFNENKYILHIATENSILGHVKDMQSKFSEYYNHITKVFPDLETEGSGYPDALQEVVSFKKALDDFPARYGYVPGGTEEGSIISAFNGVKKSVYIESFMRKRGDDAVFVGNGHFYNSAVTQVEGLGIMLREATSIMTAQFARKALEVDSEWFNSSSERKSVETAIKLWIHDLDAINNSKKAEENHRVRALKRASSVLGAIPAMILFFPSSAVNNVTSGVFNLFMSTGNKFKMRAFEDALATGGDILSKTIDVEANKYLTSVGRVKEFEFWTPTGKDAQSIDAGHALAMKIYDKLGEGLLGFIPGSSKNSPTSSLFKRMLSLKGSEERLREHIKAVLYNRCIDDINTYGISEVNSTTVKELISRHRDNATFDVLQALGDFSPASKPFWAHTMGDTAETMHAVVAGAVLKWMYMFRQPMINNIENLFIATAKSGYEASHSDQFSAKELKSTMYAGSAVGIGLMYAVYSLIRDVVDGDKDHVVVSASENLNPFQAMQSPINFMYASTIAPLFGSPVTKEVRDKIIQDNISFFLNMAGGREAREVIRENGDWDDFYRKMTAATEIPSVFTDLVLYGKGHLSSNGRETTLKSAAYDTQKRFGNAMNLDPVFAIERILELATIKDPNDPQTTNQFRAERGAKTLLTMFGLSVWRTNPKMVYEYAGVDWDNYEDYKQFKRYSKRSDYDPTDVRTFFMNYSTKYGRQPSAQSLATFLDRKAYLEGTHPSQIQNDND